MTKTSFFDTAIARQGLKRTFPLWLTHFIVWLLALPFMLNNIADYSGNAEILGGYILQLAWIGGTLSAAFFCILMSELLCNYLYSARSVSFYHSIPVRRGTLFFTHWLTSICALLIPAGLAALLGWGVTVRCGTAAYMLDFMRIYAELVVFFTGFSLLCCHMTGHVGVGNVLYTVLNFTAVVVELTVKYILSHFTYGFSMNGGLVTKPLSPIVNLFNSYGVTYVDQGTQKVARFDGNGYLAVLFIAGLALAALAYLLYRLRRSESAGEIVSASRLRPVFKYCLTAGFALVVGLLFYFIVYEARDSSTPNIALFAVCMLIGGFLGYYAAEMMLKKSLKVFKKGLRGFAAAAAVIVLFNAALAFDAFGIVRRVPDAEDVKKAYIYSAMGGFTAEIEAGDAVLADVVALHRSIVDNRAEDTDTVPHYGGSTTNVGIDYELKNGSTLSREYTIPLTDLDVSGDPEPNHYADALKAIYTDEGVIKNCYAYLWPELESEYRIVDVTCSKDAGNSHEEYLLNSDDYAEFSELMAQALLDGTAVNSQSYYWTDVWDYDEVYYIDISTMRTEDGNRSNRWDDIIVTPDAEALCSFLETHAKPADLPATEVTPVDED